MTTVSQKKTNNSQRTSLDNQVVWLVGRGLTRATVERVAVKQFLNGSLWDFVTGVIHRGGWVGGWGQGNLK